jgi:hypothetical protein
MPYENTESCWEYLQTASRYAQYLRLITPTQLIDQRNPDQRIYASLNAHDSQDPDWSYTFDDWELPRVDFDLTSDLQFAMPD